MMMFFLGILFGILFSFICFVVYTSLADGTLVIGDNPWQLAFDTGEDEIRKKRVMKIKVVFKK